MSMMPAFSPGPCSTCLLRVGSRFKCTRDDLYEQCSLHITLKMPSSVNDGSRPSELLTRSYSSGVKPCSFTTAGVIADACVVVAMAVISILAFFRSPDPKGRDPYCRETLQADKSICLPPLASTRISKHL